MSRVKRKRREMEAAIEEIQAYLAKPDAPKVWAGEERRIQGQERKAGEERRLQFPTQGELRRRKMALAQFESAILIKKAISKGIDLPSHQEKPLWWDDDIEEYELQGAPEEAIARWLSERGRIGVTKSLEEEWKKNAEWWVKVVSPLLSILVSLLSLFIALVALLLRK